MMRIEQVNLATQEFLVTCADSGYLRDYLVEGKLITTDGNPKEVYEFLEAQGMFKPIVTQLGNTSFNVNFHTGKKTVTNWIGNSKTQIVEISTNGDLSEAFELVMHEYPLAVYRPQYWSSYQ